MMTQDIEVNDPVMPRKRRVPQRYEMVLHNQNIMIKHLRRIYFEVLDLLIQAIEARFDQQDYKIYSCLESLLLKAASRQDFSTEIAKVLEVYGTDFNASLIFRLSLIF